MFIYIYDFLKLINVFLDKEMQIDIFTLYFFKRSQGTLLSSEEVSGLKI